MKIMWVLIRNAKMTRFPSALQANTAKIPETEHVRETTHHSVMQAHALESFEKEHVSETTYPSALQACAPVV